MPKKEEVESIPASKGKCDHKARECIVYQMRVMKKEACKCDNCDCLDHANCSCIDCDCC